MKKVMRFACLVGVFALALTSCKKNNENANMFNAATEQLVFEDADVERVYINTNNQVIFEEGDECMLFNIDNNNGTSSSAKYVATSTGNVVHFTNVDGEIGNQRKDAFYGFYPGENVTSQLGQGNRSTFRLDAVQNYREGKVPHGALYMASKVDDVDNLDNSHFQFHNICGIVSLKFYSTTGKTIKRIKVTDKHFGLSGNVQLIIPEVDPVEMTALLNSYDMSNQTYVDRLNDYISTVGYNVTNSTKSITLDLGDAGVTLSTSKSTANQFYMVLRPLALKYGCKIYVSEERDGENWIEVADSNKDNMIRPNVIKSFSAIKVD